MEITLTETLLKQDDGVRATLIGDIVRKKVIGMNKSGLFGKRYDPKTMVDREVKALQLLEGVQGVQQLVRRTGEETFESRYVEGTPLRNQEMKSLPKEYFRQLRGIMEECISRGVYKIGLNRLDFLVTPNKSPAVIDFGQILFEDDPSARIMPGATSLARLYIKSRIKYLEWQLSA